MDERGRMAPAYDIGEGVRRWQRLQRAVFLAANVRVAAAIAGSKKNPVAERAAAGLQLRS
jgi:hypothetical protein